MKPLNWIDGRLRFLDQTKLPLEEFYCEIADVQALAQAIKCLAIRGAPLIGIAAAYGVALASYSLKITTKSEVQKILHSAIELLASTRSTAVNLFWALNRQRQIVDSWKSDSIKELQEALLDEAMLIHSEDAEMCERISSYGVQLLPQDCTILTHCNAGALATGGRGTAIGIISKAWENGILKHVYIDETRPLLQGARLTAWEMMKLKIPATLITDNSAAFLMQQGKVQAVIVGADRIATNGDVANKIGTYNVAVLAKEHGIPFFVASPISTIDFNISNGKQIPIEERSSEEVRRIGGLQIAPEEIVVYSQAFDITPNQFITAIVTDKGILKQPLHEALRSLKIQISNTISYSEKL
jgi:methylthioribose-1-phosphate isomerase